MRLTASSQMVGTVCITACALLIAALGGLDMVPACADGSAPDRPSVGAIRWDGWFKGNPWQKNLGPKQWHERLPFYGKVISDTQVEVVSDSQEVMDREIQYAHNGGLDYWAFCYYYPKSWNGADAYNYGWRRYLASPYKSQLGFCLNLQWGHLGPRQQWPVTVAGFVKLFKEPTYWRVAGGRPLVYIFNWDYMEKQWGSVASAKRGFDDLRTASLKAGLGNPYIVAQVFSAADGARCVDQLGFDAIGAYSAPASNEPREYPFVDLGGANAYYWNQFKATGKSVVPLVNAGWDGRPRNYSGGWYVAPKPSELAEHLAMGLQWCRANRAQTPADTVLMYAWNESDEGGWLVPTLAEGTARLDALRTVLGRGLRQR